jgi:hypothetical protein
MNTIEIPWTLATAGLVGLGGLAFLIGAVLSSVAELLALLRAHRDWAGSDARSSQSPVMRPGLRRPRSDNRSRLAGWFRRNRPALGTRATGTSRRCVNARDRGCSSPGVGRCGRGPLAAACSMRTA